MTGSDQGATGVRGTKRKQSDEVRLTFSQRLAAARKVPKHAELGSDATPDDVDDSSSLKFANSSDVEESPAASKHLEQDERYREIYANEVDFFALARKDADFSACLKSGRHLEFSDPASVMQLTKTLLKIDFGLQLELPDDRLCPPVPNRHNYILWLKELLDSSSPSYAEAYEGERKVTGLDIGTGASAIYPLLGCIQRPAWSFTATDIDARSLSFARKNVELNNLSRRIQILERANDDLLIPLQDLDVEGIDFVMTNPPFYTSEAELLELAKLKDQPPNSACTGAPNEMICDGGEIGFFRRIFDESVVLKSRIQWYTIMLGKQSSLEVIVNILKQHDIDNYAVAEFVQGSKTRRWAIGWSFGNLRPSHKACRGFEPSVGKKVLPPPTEVKVASKSSKRGGAEQVENIFWTQLEDVTDGLDLVSWSLDEDRLRVVGFADQNVWSRAHRRSRPKQPRLEPGSAGSATKSVSDCVFGFSIAIKTCRDQTDKQEMVNVMVRWLQGTDYSLFESFSGMLRNAFLNVLS